MAKKPQMSDAERYRLERKKRIQKESKKKNRYVARNRQKVEKVSKIASIAVAAIAVVAVTLALLNHFGVFNRMITAAEIAGQKISVAEYNCAYGDMQNKVLSASEEYKSTYGYSYYSYDTHLTEPSVYQDDDGKTMTWGEYFESATQDYLKSIKLFSEGEGNELTDAQKEEIESTIKSLTETAKTNNYSLNAYLKLIYGNGVNQKVFRGWMEVVFRAQNVQTKMYDDYLEALDDGEVEQYYKDNKESYDAASFKYYVVDLDLDDISDDLKAEGLTEEKATELVKDAKAAAQKKTDELMKQIQEDPSKFADVVKEQYKQDNQDKDDYTALSDSDITVKDKTRKDISGYPADLLNWAFDSSRKAGDLTSMYVQNVESSQYIFVIAQLDKVAVPYNVVDVRHILLQPEGTDTSTNSTENVTDEAWEACKTKAEDLLKEWENGDATEESFGTLANGNTADTGSKTNGGLYQNVAPGQMVDTFDAWIFDSARKSGDTGIVKTDYGYHIIYFVNNNGVNWKALVPDTMASEYVDGEIEKELEENEIKLSTSGLKRVENVKLFKKQQKTSTTTTTTTAPATTTTTTTTSAAS